MRLTGGMTSGGDTGVAGWRSDRRWQLGCGWAEGQLETKSWGMIGRRNDRWWRPIAEPVLTYARHTNGVPLFFLEASGAPSSSFPRRPTPSFPHSAVSCGTPLSMSHPALLAPLTSCLATLLRRAVRALPLPPSIRQMEQQRVLISMDDNSSWLVLCVHCA